MAEHRRDKNWIVFSHDKKWHGEYPPSPRSKNTRSAALPGASVPTWDKYVCLARAYDKIKARMNTPKPFIFRVDYNYRVDAVKIP